MVDRQRELAAAPGRQRRALDADDVAEVELDQQLVGLLAEQVLASVQLDLAGGVAQVEEAGLAVPAPADQPPGDPMPRLGLDPRRQPLVRRPHLADLLAVGELGRERVDPRLPQPLELLPPVAREHRRASVVRPRSSEREPIREPLGRLDLGDLQFLLRAARNLDRDDVVALVAEQGFADRRLVGELVLERVGLGRADDLELLRVVGLLVLDVDDRAELTSSVPMSFSSITVARRSRSSSWAIRCSSRACSFLASSYSAFSEMSPNSRASLIRSATSRRFTVVR